MTDDMRSGPAVGTAPGVTESATPPQPPLVHEGRGCMSAAIPTRGPGELRVITTGASVCPASLKREVTAIFGPCLYESYGSTETGIVTLLTPADHPKHADSAGRILDGADVRILSDDGKELPRGTAGQIFIKSPVTIRAYVGDGGLEVAIPVHEAIAAIDETVPEHGEERPAHRTGADGVHGEALALPVARAAHRLLLADDPSLVLVLPVLDAPDEALAAEIVTCLAFELEEPLLDDRLRRDPGVIGSGLPERVLAHHAMPSDEEVLHHVVHRVPHVQRAGDVRERHHDHVTASALVREGAKRVAREPTLVDRCLDPGWVVLPGKFVLHG